MTMIKKDGHWVTVAGGQRMWVGTKAQLDAALAAGELEDGTAIMVTDDYAGSGAVKPDWGNAVTISAAQIQAGYTTPSNGMIVGYWIRDDSVTTAAHIFVNSNIAVGVSDEPGEHVSISVPVNKDDVIVSDYAIKCSFHFVPWK